MRQSSETHETPKSEDTRNLMFVNYVKGYPCLYNQSLPEYLKKDDTDAAWNEVASYMRQTVQECKEKWRNLRYSFLRSLKPHPGGNARKKYYLHKEMEFLLPFMKTRYDGVATSQFEEDSEDDINDNNNVEDAIVLEQPANHLDYCALEFTEPTLKRRKTTNYRSTREPTNTECPRKHFLLSLLPELNSLTEVQMKAFRRKVFKLIDDVSENDGQGIQGTACSSVNVVENSTGERELITQIKTDPITMITKHILEE